MTQGRPHPRTTHDELVRKIQEKLRQPPKSEASLRAMTAQELMEEFGYARRTGETDPAYVARVLAVEEHFRKAREAYAAAAEGLLKDLAAVGFEVSTAGELVQRRLIYKEAIPVLLRWLPKVTYTPLKDDIICTLSVPWAKPEAVPVLLREFRDIDDPTGTGLRWVVGNALEVLADDSVFDEIVALVQDKRYGTARHMVVLALAKMKDPRAVDLLIDLLDDEDEVMMGYAVMALGKLKASMAREKIERLVNHPQTWIRQEVKKALAKIDKWEQKKKSGPQRGKAKG